MKVLCFQADLSGCWKYRLDIPFRALEKLGVEVTYLAFVPGEVGVPQLHTLINVLRDFDLVIIQRTYVKALCLMVRNACDVVGIPLVFETDDDYLSLIPSNPCYFALAGQEIFIAFNTLKEEAQNLANQGKLEEANEVIGRANEMIPTLMASRKQGEEEFKDILRMVDAVTVSTEELARTIRPYNKYVRVFENAIDSGNPYRHCIAENDCVQLNEDGTFNKLVVPERHNLTTIPSYAILKRENGPQEILKTPRIAYSCSASHFPNDWNTIVEPLNNVVKKYPHCWWFFLGDRSLGNLFASTIQHNKVRIVTTFGLPYDLYMINLMNSEIGICPLEFTIFNMSKSDIKAVEYASVGAAILAPDYITYTRHWKDNETALIYRSEKEFEEKLSLLIEKSELRKKLGKAAYNYVISERLSKHQVNQRFEFYSDLVSRFPRLKSFRPNKG